MPLFAANLTMMYGEVPFLERFSLAATDGFMGVEYLFPYEYESKNLRELLQEYNLNQALFNAPAGNWTEGERGLASLPNRQSEFLESLDKAFEYANSLDCPRVHIMCGNRVKDVPPKLQREIFIENLTIAAEKAAQANKMICIEAISSFTMPNYFLQNQAEALAIVQEVNKTNLQIQFDIFHCQMQDGNISYHLENAMPMLGHIQIAGTPSRHEPNIGELNYNYIFNQLDKNGYRGWIGCEYIPSQKTSAGLDWFQPWKDSQAQLRLHL